MFHWFNEEGTRYNQYDDVRQTYDGPLSMATDMMVWNVRTDEIIERMAVSADAAWDVPGPGRASWPDPDFPASTPSTFWRGASTRPMPRRTLATPSTSSMG
jgi:hypothetical protein